MRIPSPKGLKPTAPAADIRARIEGLAWANVALLATWAIVALLSEFVFHYGEAAFFGAILIFVFYVSCCVALGRLAACFGESATSWAISAFFFYIIILVLAFFAFGDGVRSAYGESG